ncbi:rhamnan synthesis F family protein [Pseudoclavibacter helvolus]|uniref:Rhamnosyltransferase n=1 Tax=Pseudoclavibacter helvolus TaxID=255205 RepID=A0A7W4UMW8_9MICO|nr:rhamnan synthesis F family protein [Pseudoclavibacter helvolus]MBB2957382.1 rhamnosyltransferase [Pseudoclavibacter helvolus]
MRRVAFYLVYDSKGHVGGYVEHCLRELRKHVDHVFVVSNSPLTTDSRYRLEQIADTVWERQNVGYDVWAYRDALREFGEARLRDYDELILANYTFYGPIGSFDALFAEAEDTRADFWGITDHAEVVPNPITYSGVMPRHIQSHWIGVRRHMFTSEAWRTYWDEMPPIVSYDDSILQHESRFTKYFEDAGFSSWVAYSAAKYGDQHPIFNLADVLIADGCPIVKRRFFFHDPVYLDHNAIIGKRVLDLLEAKGYPVDLLWQDIASTAKPRVLNANAGLMEIMPDVDLGGEDPSGLRVVVVAHVYYEEMIDEIVERADTIPGGYDLVVTTASEEKQAYIRARLEQLGRPDDDVRVVASNRGRDISAFLITCRDVLESDRYDIVVKIHSKKSPQNGFNSSRHFKEHLFENLLNSPGYTTNLLRLFVKHPTLGMVFPPMIHIGFPTVGRAWFANLDPAKELAAKLGMRVTFDDTSPLAPFGSMFIARPEALKPLVQAGFHWDEFPDEGGYEDGGLPHVLERLLGYSAVSEGFHLRTVMTIHNAEISHTMLEYKLQEITADVPGYFPVQVALVRKYLESQASSPLGRVKSSILTKNPGLADALRPAYSRLRGVARAIRNRG